MIKEGDTHAKQKTAQTQSQRGLVCGQGGSAAHFVYGVYLRNLGHSTKMLPGKLMAVLGAALLLIVVLVGLLTWKSKYRARYVIGLVLAVIMCVIFGVGTSYVFKGLTTAKEITTVRTETAAVGIYVRADDTNDYAQVAGTYSYGILADQDRENTNEAIKSIESEYSVSLNTTEYPVWRSSSMRFWVATWMPLS